MAFENTSGTTGISRVYISPYDLLPPPEIFDDEGSFNFFLLSIEDLNQFLASLEHSAPSMVYEPTSERTASKI
jgi:hypothetical protein